MNIKTKQLNESRLAVIEGKWFPTEKLRRNTSVRDLFDLLCNLNFSSSQEYHYEMFNNYAALKEIVLRMTAQISVHYLYIACHGTKEGIQGSNSVHIPLGKVAKIIADAGDVSGKLHGIYFGSCLFGQELSLIKLLKAGTKILWIAGYGKEIDFVKSSAFDMIFWNHFSCQDGSELIRINKTCSWINANMPGLIKELDFRVYSWERGKYKILAGINGD
jgi:hypothetical protein